MRKSSENDEEFKKVEFGDNMSVSSLFTPYSSSTLIELKRHDFSEFQSLSQDSEAFLKIKEEYKKNGVICLKNFYPQKERVQELAAKLEKAYLKKPVHCKDTTNLTGSKDFEEYTNEIKSIVDNSPAKELVKALYDSNRNPELLDTVYIRTITQNTFTPVHSDLYRFSHIFSPSQAKTSTHTTHPTEAPCPFISTLWTALSPTSSLSEGPLSFLQPSSPLSLNNSPPSNPSTNPPSNPLSNPLNNSINSPSLTNPLYSYDKEISSLLANRLEGLELDREFKRKYLEGSWLYRNIVDVGDVFLFDVRVLHGSFQRVREGLRVSADVRMVGRG